MKYLFIKYIVLLVLIVSLNTSAIPQDNPIKLKGSFLTDQRIRSIDGHWAWNENRLRLNISSKLGKKAAFSSQIWVRSFGFPSINTTQDLYETAKVIPFDASLRTAYIDLYEFIIPALDLRVGRQHLAWGKADQINPSNVLSPLDLEDIWDFGRYSGSDAVKLSYYLKKLKIEAVWLPFFRPAILPYGDWSDLFKPQIEAPMGFAVKEYSDSIYLPELSLNESSSYGLRLLGSSFNFDWSVGYAFGYDHLPVASRNIVTTASFTELNILSKLVYFRQHALMADVSGQIGSIGVWAEAVALKPLDSIIMVTDLSAFGIPDMDSLLYDNSVFVKFIVGLDHTFSDASYLNIQYLHGFFHERSKELKDYIFFNYSKNILSDKLKLEPLQGAFVFGDIKDIKNHYALIYTPSITYFPNDNTELSLGYRWIEGKGDNLFAMVKDKDEVFIKMIYHF